MIRECVYLLVLALPVACISWTVTHEEFFREPRELANVYMSAFGRLRLEIKEERVQIAAAEAAEQVARRRAEDSVQARPRRMG